MARKIVSLSGGMDSTTLLARALRQKDVLGAYSFQYNSKHNARESDAAIAVARHYKVPHSFINLSGAFSDIKSALLRGGAPIPEGHYEDESMSQTVVPGRNIMFAATLAGIAWTVGADEIWMGIHAGDHAIYPDCRPAFFEAMRHAILEGTDNKVELRAPFLHRNKTSILSEGLDLGVPYHLTRTCYQADVVACGKCGACQERLESFELNGEVDPIDYVSREILPK